MTSAKAFARLLLTSSWLAAVAAPSATAADGVVLTRDHGDSTSVVGRVDLPASPSAVSARLERVDQWRALFPDIRKLEVKKHEGSYWRVRLDSAIFSCGPHDYEVRLAGDHSFDLKILAPGVDAFGRISVRPTPTWSAAEYRLTVRVGRVASWFASEAAVRKKQEALVRSYLDALAAVFAPTLARTGSTSRR